MPVGRLVGVQPKYFGKAFHEIDFEFSEEEEHEIERYCKKIKENIKKEKMTPRERWEATLEGRKVDRPLLLLFPLNVAVCRVLDGWADAIKPIDMWLYPKLLLKAHLAYLARFGYDALTPYSMSYGEVEWGGEAKLMDYAHPVQTKHPVEKPEDADKLEIPSPWRDGFYPAYLWLVRKARDIFRAYGLIDEIPIYASYCNGPVWYVAMSLRGSKEWLLDLKRNPELSHKLFKLAAEWCIRYGKAVTEASGEDIAMLCSSFATMPYDVWKNYASYHVDIVKAVPGTLWALVFDNISHGHLEYLAQMGGVGIGFHQAIGPKDAPLEGTIDFAKKWDKFVIPMMSDELLLSGPISKIEEEVNRFAKVGLTHNKLALATGTIDYWTPPEHIDAFVRAVKKTRISE